MTSLKGVERRTENVKTDDDPSGWRPCHTFLETLHEKYLKNDGEKGEKGTVMLKFLLFFALLLGCTRMNYGKYLNLVHIIKLQMLKKVHL